MCTVDLFTQHVLIYLLRCTTAQLAAHSMPNSTHALISAKCLQGQVEFRNSLLCSPYNDGNAVFNYIFMVIFFVDSCLSFRVAIIENDILITHSKEIAKSYLRSVSAAAFLGGSRRQSATMQEHTCCIATVLVVVTRS